MHSSAGSVRFGRDVNVPVHSVAEHLTSTPIRTYVRSMYEMLGALTNVEAYGVDGANERADEADEAYAAGEAAVAALGEIAPGPQLATALLDAGKLAMSAKSRIDLLGHWERQRGWTEAQTMVVLGGACGAPDIESDSWVIADIARSLRISESSVGTRVALMRHVSTGLPETWEALNAGTITPAHMWVLANVTRDASADLTVAVEEQVLAKAIARGWTPAKLAEAARTAMMKLDPDGAEQRARDAKKQRSDVTFRSDEDMMAALTARTDAWTARQTMDEINRRADEMRRNGDERTLGELRIAALAKALLGFDADDPTGDISDALADTASADGETGADDDTGADDETGADETHADEAGASAPARRQPKRATALLLITLPTLLGGDQPGYLDGYGPITASLARRIAAGDVRFRRLLLDPAPGKPVDRGDASDGLSPEMRRWVDARDRACRFPGCRRRAVYCDADHSVEWPVGRTTCANCGLLCRPHHNFKTSKAWRLTRNDDDSVDWESPLGFDWHVEAATYEEFLDPGPPAAAVA